MLIIAGERRKPRLVDRMHRDARGLGALDQIARPAIVTRNGDVDGPNAIGQRAQPRSDRVKS